jgi:hypothetical protein
LIGAGQRSDDRTTHRNGHRDRELETQTMAGLGEEQIKSLPPLNAKAAC